MSASPDQRWPALAQHLPAEPAAYHAAIATLLERGEYGAADQGVAAGMALFPQNAAIAIQAAQAAERKREWRAAVAAWQHAHACAPNDLDIIAALAAMYLRTSQTSQADALLTAALRGIDTAAVRRGSPVIRLMIEHARTAAFRGDFASARTRWQALALLVPEDPAVKRGLKKLSELNLPETRNKAPLAPSPGPVAETAPADLMMRFEGLGGTCEFGLVQRHFGVEPLGLFRWVTINLNNVCTAIGDEMRGIGEPQYTNMSVAGGGEFVTTDSRYILGMHTFLRDTGQDREKLLGQLRRRMRFLREKLLEDLRAGEKIFVYRNAFDTSDEQMARLLSVVRSYNPANRLVIIKVLPHGEQGEALTAFAENALTGAIANGRKPEKGAGWAIDFDFWLETCQTAAHMLDG